VEHGVVAAVVALFGLLAGLLVWYWVTRPVKQLTVEVAGLEQDSISAIKQLAGRRRTRRQR
jgi:hypothetical protein